MKTNKILMAVALPTLLAACTAEEIVEQSPVANISGRALLDPNFSVSVAEGAESRFAWENLNWKFEEGDQFGAAVTDVATQGTVTGTSLIGNYIFSKNAAGNWNTDSQMSEGIYQYYSYEGFKTKQARELVAFDLTGQKADLSEADAEFNEYENQLMITPLYTLQEKYSTKALPLEFYSYYGVGAFKFKNETGQDLKITQIILNSETEMTVKGRVNPQAFENKAEFVYNEEAGKYVLEAVDAAMKKFNVGAINATKKAADIKAAEKAFETAIYTADASAPVNTLKGDQASKFITLDCDNYLLKNGKEVTAYMMIPAGEGSNFSVEIMVVDENDEAWSVYVNQDGSLPAGVRDGYTEDPEGIEVDKMNTLAIQRHKTNAIFGKTNDGKGLKTLKISDDNLVENTGYYVDNNEDLLALIDDDLGKIKVHNSGEVYINKEIVEAIKEYTGTHVTFSNLIEIKDTEALVADAENETDYSLTNITFNGGALVKGYNADDEFEGTTVEFGEDIVFGEDQTLTIEAGAVVTLKHGEFKNVNNNGELTVIGNNETAISRSVDEIDGLITVNRGNLTVKGCNPYIKMNAGNLFYVANKDSKNRNIPFTVTSARLQTLAGVNVTIGEDVTMNVNNNVTIATALANNLKSVAASSTWTNNGVIEVAEGKTITVEGKLVNNNEISGGTLTLIDKVNTLDRIYAFGAKVENNEDAEVEAETIIINKYSKVDNAGDFLAKDVTLNGKLNITDEKAHVNVTEGNGEINNTLNGVIEQLPAEGMLVYATMGAMTDGNELDEFDSESHINKIVVTGRWTISSTLKEGEVKAEKALKEQGIKEIEFQTKDALYLRDGAALDLTDYVIKVSEVKEVVFSGYSDECVLTINEPVKGLWYNAAVGAYEETTWSSKYVTLQESGKSVQNKIEIGGSIKLEYNIPSAGTLNVEKDVELDMNGKTLNGSIAVVKGAELIVENGVIENTDSKVSGITSNGDLTLNGVEIQSARHAVRIESGSAVINGGEYRVDGTEGMTTYALNIGDDNTKATVVIKDGKFVGPAGSKLSDSGAAVIVKKGSNLTIEGGDFSGGKIATITGEGKIVITGGTFDQNPTQWVDTKKYTVKEDKAKGVWTVSKK